MYNTYDNIVRVLKFNKVFPAVSELTKEESDCENFV